jgi:ribosomal protein L11 methyltransferase
MATRRLTWRRRASTAERDQERLTAQGFLRSAIEADSQGPRLTAWVRSATEERLVRGLLGEPDAIGQERLDQAALADWRVRLAPGYWLLGDGVAEPRQSRCIVRMPVGSGFGLGDHPTTVHAAALVCRDASAFRGRRVLDLGCGSGVLAALAGRLGATTIDAVDLDPDSVSHTRRTLRANGVTGRAWTSDLLRKVPGTYDVILANLVGDLLIELFAAGTLPLALAPRGFVVISGISAAKATAVRAAAVADGWRVTGRRVREGWHAYRLARARRTQ